MCLKISPKCALNIIGQVFGNGVVSIPCLIKYVILPPFIICYIYFLHSPLLIDDGRMSFWMEKRSGKKCFMLSARELEITWADSPDIWSWISIPDSRFEVVAALGMICWLEIRGTRPPREDGWLEIKLGEYYVGFDEEEELEMSMFETSYCDWKGGIIVQGIEIRPKAEML
ncbi:putative F-box protein PP2-B12 [Eutrema salsugineum]|uniref:putative F-box protein PP2-B12 n=1 Tax=Eutrema salsugineum TaxID=72664 RepID=UPI000CED305A|nr:putative F-box protein PP2-B12 [Eutrema salsugineum]